MGSGKGQAKRVNSLLVKKKEEVVSELPNMNWLSGMSQDWSKRDQILAEQGLWGKSINDHYFDGELDNSIPLSNEQAAEIASNILVELEKCKAILVPDGISLDEFTITGEDYTGAYDGKEYQKLKISFRGFENDVLISIKPGVNIELDGNTRDKISELFYGFTIKANNSIDEETYQQWKREEYNARKDRGIKEY